MPWLLVKCTLIRRGFTAGCWADLLAHKVIPGCHSSPTWLCRCPRNWRRRSRHQAKSCKGCPPGTVSSSLFPLFSSALLRRRFNAV